MKTFLPTVLIAGVAAVLLATLSPQAAVGQSPATSSLSDAEMAQLITDIQEQQKQIKANQDKIDAVLATAQEEVRQARIFAARGGQGGAK